MSHFFRSMTACALLLTALSSQGLRAQESFETHVYRLADDAYSVRMASIEALIKMCRKQPALLDDLAPVALDMDGDVERRLNARKVIAESLFFERGAIGFALNHELIVIRLVNQGPAMVSGIQIGSQLLSVAGEKVEGKSAADIYALVHATRPGSKLGMEFVDRDGEKLLYYPVVAARSTIRSDERPEERKHQL